MKQLIVSIVGILAIYFIYLDAVKCENVDIFNKETYVKGCEYKIEEQKQWINESINNLKK